MDQTSVSTKTASVQTLRTAIQNRMPVTGITHVVVHPNPHLDELFAMYCILRTSEGRKHFAGVDGKEPICSFSTARQIQEWTGEEGFYLALQSGYLLVGFGGGYFDEHSDRTAKASCAQLVANYLGLTKGDNAFLYQPLLGYVNFEDNNGSTLPQDVRRYANTIRHGMIADGIKKGWACVNADMASAQTVFEMAFAHIAFSVGNQRLLQKAIQELKAMDKQIVPLDVPAKGSKKPALFIVHSDNPLMASAARVVFPTNQQFEMKVLMLVRSNGQVYISPTNGLRLEEVVKTLRVDLADKKRVQRPVFEKLAMDGDLPGLGEIHYHKNSDSIMNGSLTQDDVPGIVGKWFTVEEIADDIVKATANRFHPDFSKRCRHGYCSKKACPLYRYGYAMCHAVRHPHTAAVALK